MIYKDYEMVAGLEIHVQLNTESKIFCADQNLFGSHPNEHTSVISLAHPGTLPVVNMAAIEKGIRLALAIDSKIQNRNFFDRKHYFYPDLPKAYQITQDRLPICIGGQLDIYDDSQHVIRFHHVHMEEDAGKSIHDLDPKLTFIDLNRAGVPLLEIVTEPDFRTPQEVHDFIAKLQQLVRYIGVSDANMEEGSMRCDCNVSVRPVGSTDLGERCEIKNINSKKFAMQAVEYEVKRQVEQILDGKTITKLTMHFDPLSGQTSPIRSKEDVHDYRYFPDPDQPPVIISEKQIESIKESMPTLPNVLKAKMVSVDKISEEFANVLIQNPETAKMYMQLSSVTGIPKETANLIVNKLLPKLKETPQDGDTIEIPMDSFKELLLMIKNEKVGKAVALNQLFEAIWSNPTIDIATYAEDNNMMLSHQDTDVVDGIINGILEQNPDEVKKYRYDGKKKLLGYFIGQAMKAAKGKADPKALKTKMKEALDRF